MLRIIECLLYIHADLHGCLFSFKHMLSIVSPSCHWSPQLPDGHGQSLIDLNWLYFISIVTYIANLVLSQHSGIRSASRYKKKINNKLTWKTILLIDDNKLNQSYHRRPQLPRTCHLESPTQAGADVSAIMTEELLTYIAAAGTSCKWVPCSSFFPVACLLYSTPTISPHWDSMRGAFISPCSRLSPAGAGFSDPPGKPTSPPTGPPTQEPTSPPPGTPTVPLTPRSFPHTHNMRLPKRKCATNQSKRRRRRLQLMRAVLDQSLLAIGLQTVHISIPTNLLTARLQPRLLGGALQRSTRTIRCNPSNLADSIIPPLGDDEDWYPLYVLEASRHVQQSDNASYIRDFIPKSQFMDMTQEAWEQELEIMGVPVTSATTAIHHLLPNAVKCAESYERYALPNIVINSLTLEETLSHIRIVYQRIHRLTRNRNKIQRNLAKKYRQLRHHIHSSNAQNINDLLHDLHQTRTAIVEHNERHLLLQRKAKALVKSTVKRMPRQVFVPMAAPPIPTYNRFQILSEDDTTHRRTKTWHDFIQRPPPQAPIGAVVNFSQPIPLHQSPPLQRPMEAMAQLRKDLTTYGCPVAHQSPAHTHDVRGWYLTDKSRNLSTLTVCTWNINGISTGLMSYKAEYISMIMQQDHIDVMICPDSRHTAATARTLKKLFIELLGAGTKTYFSVDKERLPGDPGGIAIIIGPKWGPSYISENSRTDHSGHGVLTKVQLRTETGHLAILGTYWPERPHEAATTSTPSSTTPTSDDNSHSDANPQQKDSKTSSGTVPQAKKLWPRIRTYRQQQKVHDPDPILYLQSLALTWIAKDRAKGCQAFILGGDFNSTWHASDKGGQRTIHKWCQDNYLINGPRLIHDRFAPAPDLTTGVDLQFITWGRMPWGWGTWIDHLLHAGDPDHISIHGAFNALGVDLDDVSDHKPMWASYVTAPPAEARVVQLPKRAKRPEISRTDQRQIAVFKSRITEVMSQLPRTVDTPLEAEEALEFATAYTVQLTREINDQVNGTHRCSHYKRGYSPEFMLRKWHLCTIVEIKRHLLGLHGKTRWTSHHAIQRGIFYMFQTIEARAAGMGMATKEVQRILSSTSLDAKFWLALPSGPTPSICDSSIKTLKKFLHGRKRMDMRKASAGYSSWIESMREQGKVGRVIKATLGVHAGRRHQDGLTIDAIQTSTGRIQGEPREIHELATAHAKASFTIPPEYRTPFHTATDWKPFVDDINLFLEAFKDSNIPMRYLQIIHKALQPIPQAAAIHAEIERLLEHPPTLEEFKKGIRQTKANSAPGPSGLTNNMTKCWPDSMVTYVHSCLSKFWTSTTIPAAQKWKWLNYIPKKSSDMPKLSDLRPLMLVEVLRKHWCTHIATTIKGVLLKHKALDDAHHGYIAGRGTGTASILHINLSEEVEEKTTALHRSSFDLRDAFGSCLDPAIDWSQRRLGIPQIVARFMASMEDEGTTVVKSEHSQNVWELLPYHCVETDGVYPVTAHTPLPGSDRISSFHAERGIGQGNPASPDQYLYHDDIIKTGMRLLEKDRRPTFAGAEDNDVFEQPDNGYADDMESASHTAELIQEKAELFSAFNIVLGLKFSPGKIRRLLQDYLPKKLRQQALHMTIYSSGWVPQHIPIATTGSSEYLGGIYDLDNSYSSAMAHMVDIAKLHVNAIKHSHFSADSKILVATTSTVNKLRYTWETSSLSHEHALQIDSILDTGHVQATRNMLSYPRKLLHIPRYLGGLGIIHFSAAGEGGKLQKLFGCMRSQQKHGSAARGILSRLCRKMGFHTSMGQQVILTSRMEMRKERKLYGDGPRQWLESHNLYICRHGRMEGFDSISGLIPALLPPEASALRTICHDLELFNISDLTEETSTGRQWWTSSSLPTDLRSLLPPQVPQGQPPLLVGQYWKLEEGVRQLHSTIIRMGDVIRIDGKFGDDVICQLYQHHNTRNGTRVKLVPGYIRLSYSELFHAPFAIRCTLAQISHDVYAIQHARRQQAPAWLVVPDPGPPNWIRWTQQQLSDVINQSTYIARPYTDGAFKMLASIEGHFRPHLAKRLATAAIIIKDDTPQWKSKPVIAIRITDGDTLDPESVYPMEFLALAGALQLTTHCHVLHDIGSDAQSILKLLPKRSRLLQNVTRDHHYLLQCADNSLFHGARQPYHVRGHAENRKPGKDAYGRLGATWNKDDWGNWIADRIAANDHDILRHHGIRVTHISITAREMYNSLRTVGQWYIGDSTGAPVLPKGLAETTARSLALSYHRERDEYRTQGGRLPTWELDSSMEHSAEIFNLRVASVAVAGTKSRIIYNKGYHGGNRAKCETLTPEERASVEKCLLCGQQDSQDHWLHSCPHKCMVRIRDDILAGLNRVVTAYRDINPLHRQLGFAFKHVLLTTDQPSRIWTANWSMEQIQLLRNNFNTDLMAGLDMKDLKKILLPLERKLAVGALSLWHTKVCEERRHRPSIERLPRRKTKPAMSSTADQSSENSDAQSMTTTLMVSSEDKLPECPPAQATALPLAHRRPYISRATRRKSRVHTQGTTVVQQSTVVQFPRLTPQQQLLVSKACHTEKSESVMVVVNPTNYGSHPIRGTEFQRICPNEKGHRVGHGFFNDAVMSAYLAILQSNMPSQLKVASPWATLQLTLRRFDEVMRALRYQNTRRQYGVFGDQKWIFFIFNILDACGKGKHFTSVGINTEVRTYTYYDYAKMYEERESHMAAVKDFLDFIDSTYPGDNVGWTAHLDGTRDMVTQGLQPDCGPGTCFIIEATASDIPLAYFTVDGIHQGREHFAHCLLQQEIPPMSSCLVSTVTTVVQQPESFAQSTQGHFTIFHEDYEYDPFCDDPVPHIDQDDLSAISAYSFNIPSLRQDQILEILEKATAPNPLEILRPSSTYPLLGTDLQDLIHPNSICDVLLHQLLADAYKDRTDVLLFPADMTRMILSCTDDVTTTGVGDPRLADLQSLQRRIPLHRFIVFIHWEYSHFTGMIVDNGDGTCLPSPQLIYLDSLKGDGTKHVLGIQRYIDWITVSLHPTQSTRSWTVNHGLTADMIRQRPYRRRHELPEAAKHIECGVYVILMIQLYFLDIPLTVLTPSKVHRYRTVLAWQLLHPEQRVPITELLVPTASSSLRQIAPHVNAHVQQLFSQEELPAPFINVDRIITCRLPFTSYLPSKRAPELLEAQTQTRRLRTRSAPSTDKAPPLPCRPRYDFLTNDPASLYTYASTSTIPDAGWGLFMGKLVGPSSPEDRGHIIGEYYGRELSKDEIHKYMYADESDVKTGFMIFFQGLGVNAWDSERGCYTCMTALINDILDSSRYNSEWVKEKDKGKPCIMVHAHKDIAENEECFIEYGNLSFCRANLPLSLLFKAVTHYYDQIMSSTTDLEYWSRIPQARTLFNSPYHTCKPLQREQIVARIQLHYTTCVDEHCTCELQTSLTAIATPAETAAKKKSNSTSRKPRKPAQRARTTSRSTTSLPTVPIPNSTNYYYDQRLLVKSADEIPGAGKGLYTIKPIYEGDIIGIYENYTGGRRPVSHRILHSSNKSHYAVKHENLIRDAWDPTRQCPCCNTAYANDSMDPNKDNAKFATHPLYPDKLLLIATKYIPGSEADPGPIYLPYGGYFWCDDCHPLEVQALAVRRYNIDIRRSTEDTDGLWSNLRNYPALCEMFPDTPEPVILTAQPVQLTQPIQPPQKRKRTVQAPPPKDSRQRTLHAYIQTSGVALADRIVSINPVVLDATMSCNENRMSCSDDFSVPMSTLLEPVSSSLASIATNTTGIITIEVDSPDRNALISQENYPANQSSIAPDTQLAASADLSHSPMEYDKRLVFI